MAELSANIRLRPARIALLVSPGDRDSILGFMRISACMWGGQYNPIIPVFRRPPKAWSAEFQGDKTGLEIARGYIRFFEPDAFVEAKPGLLETLGLQSLRGVIADRTVTLDELLAPEPHKSWADLRFGLPITDAVADMYQRGERFMQRNPASAMVIDKPPSNGLAEAMFGVYPAGDDRAYFASAYRDVFQPEPMSCDAVTWRRVYLKGTTMPLDPTSYRIDPERPWHKDLKFFVFDPSKPTDLIDLWNLRGEPAPLLPVPIGWATELAPDIQKLCAAEYQPLEGNSHGVMHSATVEFARGISDAERQRTIESIRLGLPPAGDHGGSLTVKHWRDRIWDAPGEGMMNGPSRLRLFVEEKQVTLEVSQADDYLNATYEPLRPRFASRFGAAHVRWVNSLRVSNYGRSNIATIYPYNTFDRSQPRLTLGLGEVLIGTEGWSIGQEYAGLSGTIQLETQEKAITGLLQRSGYRVSLSEPGHIAKQMLDQLGGLAGAHLIADEEILRTMNDMAGGIRRRRNGTEEIKEEFDPRSRSVRAWTELVNKRKKRDYGRSDLERFTKRNVIVLGLETRCTNCLHVNWDPMDKMGYALSCKRCLKEYPFPQGGDNGARKWAYRVAGPFSVQDYAKGAYGAVLALRAIDELNHYMGSLNFVTAVQLESDGRSIEADYVALHQPDSFDERYDPDIIFGEAKSFGEGDTLKPKDVARLQELALRFPECYLAISVLRQNFTEGEKILLRRLVRWTRKVGQNGGPRNWVLLLTGHELLRAHEPLSNTWKTIGGKHAEFADFHHTRSLKTIAEASVSIHLDLPSFSSERHAAWNRRRRKRDNDFPRIPGQWGRMLQSVSGPTSTEPDEGIEISSQDP
ncbi:hypothetical protein [Rhizobium leguminosarum]|uniref:hypothetical protein n=1 Tax=Rhizobium leguminosarum TaxID=384 RepID=UPI003F96EC02